MGWTDEALRGKDLCSHGERRQFCASCAQSIGFGILASEATGSVEWPEHMIEAECTRLLEQDGWRALRTDPVSDRGRGKGFGELGMADHLYIRYSYRHPASNNSLSLAQVIWIEFKSAKGKPAKHQIEWHTKERARGALTLIAGQDFSPSVDGFKEWYKNSGLMRRRQ